MLSLSGFLLTNPASQKIIKRSSSSNEFPSENALNERNERLSSLHTLKSKTRQFIMNPNSCFLETTLTEKEHQVLKLRNSLKMLKVSSKLQLVFGDKFLKKRNCSIYI